MTTDSVLDKDCGRMLLDRIHQHSHCTPQETALVSWDEELSYAELGLRIDRIAATLAQQGIGRGTVVAVYMARSAAAIVSLLGIMRCGAAYTVVEYGGNPVESAARLKVVAPNLVIIKRGALVPDGLRSVAYEDAVSDRTILVPVGDEVAPGDVAYILYTSGSTGSPKGVAVTHSNIRHYTISLLGRLGLDRPLSYAHVSSLSADLGNTSLLLSLWTGGTLHVVSDQMRRDARALREYIRLWGITFLKITPSHFNALFRGLHELRGPREMFEYLVLGGEALSLGVAQEILASGITRTLVNHYGPTETTVGVTVHVMRDQADLLPLHGETVPIGSALGETLLYVRTEAGIFESRGARGELYIGGPSVALGYVNDESGTRDRFVTGINENVRFYRTGDLCQVDNAGVVEFLGRLDRQVKINGYRVELDHVGAAVGSLPAVRGANAFLRQEEGKSLLVAAYLAEGELDESALIEELRMRIPGYMVPSRFIRFDAFPLNPNGKVDVALLEAAVVERLSDEDASEASPPSPLNQLGDDPVHQHVVEAWQAHLRHRRFGDDANFFVVGGDSISAIQVISDLQVRGYYLTPTQFLKQPSVRALVEVIKTNTTHPCGSETEILRASTEFSASQSWFFRQDFANPNHWNQSILLRSSAPVDQATLEDALTSVLALHPMLRCCYRRTNRGWEARTLDLPASSCLSVHQVPQGHAAGIAQAVKRASEALNRQIDLESGEIFKVCLLKMADGRDQLLFVCHHLSVDAVSWRIIFDDLVRFYSACSRKLSMTIPSSATGFWEWVLHMKENHPRMETDLEFWRQNALAPPHSAGEDLPLKENLEGLASTLWIRFSAEETELLSSKLLTRLDTQTHIALLGAFAYAYGKVTGEDRLVVDVESHGRGSFDDAIDVSRVVGWFTSTFPVRLEVKERGVRECITEVGRALGSVPNLGMAYGELSSVPGREKLGIQAPICYNYLGDFHFRHDDRLRLAVSRYPLGPARGAWNDRVYDLKLTARIVNGELAVDLSFSRARHDASRMRCLLCETKEALLREIGVSCAPESELVLDNWSSSGLLTYVPDALQRETKVSQQKNYRHVLLTGATGYIGAHVLHELLRQTDAQIHCLVRGSDLESGRAKLADVYQHYLGYEGALDFRRITVLLGDLATPRLGLSDAVYRDLATRLDAIYHFAAETRLFGPAERFEKHNVDAVQSLIQLASSYKAKDLHHMSTLAVAGINRSHGTKIFSELCLDIGQDFQNEYERSKFQAEKLVFRFKAEGGSGYIYRSGNVSGRLDTAQFQRNAAANRLVQLLRAICKAGKLPEAVDEDIALSPVDAVARAIVRISLDSSLAAGVFHVDSTHVVPFASILGLLQEIGFRLEGTRQKSFRTLFEGLDSSHDPDLALGLFWASRSSRNIEFVHDNTHRLLGDLGCAIPPLDETWLRLYLSRLVQDGVLRPVDKDVAARE